MKMDDGVNAGFVRRARVSGLFVEGEGGDRRRANRLQQLADRAPATLLIHLGNIQKLSKQR